MKQINKMTVDECRYELINNPPLGCEGLTELVEIDNDKWCATVELSDLEICSDTELGAIRNAVKLCRKIGKIIEKNYYKE